MADRRILTPDLFRQLLIYDAETGLFTWLERDVSWFRDGYQPAQAYCDIWNTKYAGKDALTQTSTAGYKVGSVLDIKVMAHRVGFSMHYGIHIEDIDQIDHINGRPADNRIVNLRHVDAQANQRNTKIGRANTSGVMGVSWDKSRTRWMASIHVDGLMKNLGRFVRFEDAVAARKAAEVQHGYHENHGRRGP